MYCSVTHCIPYLPSDLDDQLAQEKKDTLCKSTSPDKEAEDIEEVCVVSGGNQGGEEDEGLLVDKRDAQYMTECVYEDVEYRVGDVVYVRAR